MRLDIIVLRRNLESPVHTFAIEQQYCYHAATDAGISEIKDGTKKDEVIASDEGEPVGPVPLHEREIEHIDNLTLEQRSIALAPWH